MTGVGFKMEDEHWSVEADYLVTSISTLVWGDPPVPVSYAHMTGHQELFGLGARFPGIPCFLCLPESLYYVLPLTQNFVGYSVKLNSLYQRLGPKLIYSHVK